MSSLMNAALSYAELGYRVFPCQQGGKTPLPGYSFRDATNDPGRIREWWSGNPDANIGLSTDGILVIDVDGTDASCRSLERAENVYSVPVSITPSGGRHYVLQVPPGENPKNTTGVIAPFVDAKTGPGYIVVPPSRLGAHPYRWVPGRELGPRSGLPLPPDWVMEVLKSHAQAAEILVGDHVNASTRLEQDMRRFGMPRAKIYTPRVRASGSKSRNIPTTL